MTVHTLKNILDRKGDDVSTAPATISIAECLRLMNESNIGSIVIMTDDKIEGLFTERAVVRNVCLQKLDIENTPVSEVMRTEIYTLGLSAPLEAAMQIFTDKRVRHIPVLEEEKMVGMISIGDVTKWIIDQQKDEIDHLSHYIADDHHGIKPE
jgi:CBS domain-containing protein